MNFIINPGTGPVANATIEHATVNIKQLILDSELKYVKYVRLPHEDHEGRFSFLLYAHDSPHHCIVDMPGLPLDKVRYMGEPDQNICDYPRLYVDGNSYVWKYAMLEQSDFKCPEEA